MANAIPQQLMSFLAQCAPWEHISDLQRSALLQQCKSLYLTDGTQDLLLEQGKETPYLALIQSGDFELALRGGQGQHTVRFVSQSDYFCWSEAGLLLKAEALVKVHTPGLICLIPESAVADLAMQYRAISQFFESYKYEQDIQSVKFQSKSWQEKSLRSHCQFILVTVMPGDTIQTAAKLMHQKNVSSLLVVEQDTVVGIVTDRDLRNRVLAVDLNVHNPISEVMTENPATVSVDDDWLDAVCLMSERGISHVPILDGDTPVGLVSKTDIIRQQRNSIGYLIKGLAKSGNLYELMQQAWQIPHYIRFNMQGNQSFAAVGQWLSRATDVMTRKLIEFYANEHGPAPMQYCWLVYGSQARKDQLLTSDQDNGLLLERNPNKDEAEYFKGMAEQVCQGLAKCGIKLCSGNIMASNPELRLSLDAALAESRSCVEEPTNDTIMHFNIYLDVRMVQGSETLFESLQKERAKQFKRPLFLAALAREIDSNELPINMFKRFVFDKNTDKPHCINLKEKAVAIVNSIVRLYALADEVGVAGTLERLKQLSEQSGLVDADRKNLESIWLFLNELRMRSQLSQSHPDNLVAIDDLAPTERHQLKNAFKVIERAKNAVVLKFSAGMS